MRSPSIATRIVTILALLSLWCWFSGCSEDEGDEQSQIRHTEDFIPPETTGMTKDGPVQIATDQTTLEEIINGGYQFYINNGFQELAAQNYLGTVGTYSNIAMEVWICDVQSAANGAGLHADLMQTGSWEQVDELGDADFRSEALTAYTILFRRGKYFMKLIIDLKTQDAKNLLGLFASHIDQEIAG